MEEQAKDLQLSSADDELGTDRIFVFNCPYLGTLDDADTSLAYPASANHCYRTNSPTAVDLSHQEAYCLADQHPNCHVFQLVSADDAGMEAVMVRNAPAKKGKRRLSLYALPLVLVLILLAAIIWWPAPGTTIQESLVRGAQNDRAASGATLTGKPAPQPEETNSAVEVAVADPAAESITGPSLSDAGEAGQTASTRRSSNAASSEEATARVEGQPSSNREAPVSTNQTNEAPQAAEPSASPSDPNTTTEEEPPAAGVTDESTAGDNNEEQPSPVDVFEDAAGSSSSQKAASNIVEEIAATEEEEASEAAEEMIAAVEEESEDEESKTIFTSDLPVIATENTPVVDTQEDDVSNNSAGQAVMMVGPSSSSALSLGDIEETSFLSVYQGPANDGALVSVIEERQFVTLLGRDSSGQWLNIRLANGIEGWVNSDQSGIHDDAAALPSTEGTSLTLAATSYPVIRQAYVDTGALNFRSGPGVEYEAISILSKGQIVGLIGRRALGPWVRIRLDSGEEGWVNSSLLAPIS